MAVELRTQCEKRLGVTVPLVHILNGATVHTLVERLLDRMLNSETRVNGLDVVHVEDQFEEGEV
jgi:hypothetical protein